MDRWSALRSERAIDLTGRGAAGAGGSDPPAARSGGAEARDGAHCREARQCGRRRDADQGAPGSGERAEAEDLREGPVDSVDAETDRGAAPQGRAGLAAAAGRGAGAGTRVDARQHLRLRAEKKALTKQWAKREIEIERVLMSTAGLCGDLQAIVGRSLVEVE